MAVTTAPSTWKIDAGMERAVSLPHPAGYNSANLGSLVPSWSFMSFLGWLGNWALLCSNGDISLVHGRVGTHSSWVVQVTINLSPCMHVLQCWGHEEHTWEAHLQKHDEGL